LVSDPLPLLLLHRVVTPFRGRQKLGLLLADLPLEIGNLLLMADHIIHVPLSFPPFHLLDRRTRRTRRGLLSRMGALCLVGNILGSAGLLFLMARYRLLVRQDLTTVVV
jgi:hypothetical protein